MAGNCLYKDVEIKDPKIIMRVCQPPDSMEAACSQPNGEEFG